MQLSVSFVEALEALTIVLALATVRRGCPAGLEERERRFSTAFVSTKNRTFMQQPSA
jgi:hypothetical protein